MVIGGADLVESGRHGLLQGCVGSGDPRESQRGALMPPGSENGGSPDPWGCGAVSRPFCSVRRLCAPQPSTSGLAQAPALCWGPQGPRGALSEVGAEGSWGVEGMPGPALAQQGRTTGGWAQGAWGLGRTAQSWCCCCSSGVWASVGLCPICPGLCWEGAGLCGKPSDLGLGFSLLRTPPTALSRVLAVPSRGVGSGVSPGRCRSPSGLYGALAQHPLGLWGDLREV